MTSSTSARAIGRGKPPLHTRFQKGQSGVSGGKPGPAKLAKMRFQRELCAALEAAPEELALSTPATSLAAIARRMALDAAAGRGAAQRLVLSLLDAECEREDQTAPARNEPEPFSLVQGESQGSREQCLEDILWPEGFEKTVRADDACQEERADETVLRANAQTQNEADPFSLVQGESQGGRENSIEAARRMQEDPPPQMKAGSQTVPARNEAQSLSLAQGKTQGNGKNPAEPVCAAPKAHRIGAAAPAETGKRAQLMMGTAAVLSAGSFRFGLP